jgi:hypothetical protein
MLEIAYLSFKKFKMFWVGHAPTSLAPLVVDSAVSES